MSGAPLTKADVAAPVLADDGHLLAFGIERNLFDGGKPFFLDFLQDARLGGGGEERGFGRVADDAARLRPPFATSEALLHRTPH